MNITKNGNVMNVTRAIYKDIYQPKGWKIQDEDRPEQVRNVEISVDIERPVRKSKVNRKQKDETIELLRSEPND